MTHYSTYDDEQLLTLLKDNNVQAFTVLYERYWDRMLYVAIGKLKSPSQGEEIVQDVFTDIWKRRQRLEVRGKFSTYLAVAVKYRILNLLAKEKQALAYTNYKSHTTDKASTCTEDWITSQDLQEKLFRKIDELPEKGRLAFRLSRESGLSHKEIAREMKISEKAVERNIARSVRTLYTSMRHLLTSI